MQGMIDDEFGSVETRNAFCECRGKKFAMKQRTFTVLGLLQHPMNCLQCTLVICSDSLICQIHSPNISTLPISQVGRNSSVSTETYYGLDGPGIQSW